MRSSSARRAGCSLTGLRAIFKASYHENVPSTGKLEGFTLQPLLPAFAGAWLWPTAAHACREQADGAMRAGMRAAKRSSPRSSDLSSGPEFAAAEYRGEMSVGAVSVGGPAPNSIAPPNRAAPRKAEPSAPRRHCSCPLLPSSATALRGRRASPKSRRPRNEPRSPAGCPPQPEPGVPAGGRDWRTDRGKQREGEETQPREHVKSLREGRWKITLALSRPVLLCAARRAIFLRS